MSYNFLPYEQEQLFLMPPALQEWVREDSLAHFISEVVEELGTRGRMGAFYARDRADGWGRAAYHPSLMVKVLLYAYSMGLLSSRKIAQALEQDVAFRFLAANQQPDFRTLCTFRSGHREALEGLFVEVLQLCREAGLVSLGRVALDGRKVQGNASLECNRTRVQLEGAEQRLRESVQQMLGEAEAVDAAEDQQYGPQQRGDELPPDLRRKETRRKRLQQAIASLQEREKAAQAEQAKRIEERAAQREAQAKQRGRRQGGRPLKAAEAVKLPPQTKANTSDPDSRALSTRRGWVQGYNGQAMVECESQVIVAQQITQEQNDVHQLAPMLKRCEAQAGAAPNELLADAGYWSEENAALEAQRTELFIAVAARSAQEKPIESEARRRMEEKLGSEPGRTTYAQRKASVEPVFGQMEMRGLRRFLLRGKEKVQMEWSLWCTTHNLLKLWRAQGRAPRGLAAA